MGGMFICYVENNMEGQIKSQCFDSEGECLFFLKQIFLRKDWILNSGHWIEIQTAEFLWSVFWWLPKSVLKIYQDSVKYV